MNAGGPGRERHDGQLDRGVPLRQVASRRPVPPVAGRGRCRRAASAPRGARLLGLPHRRSQRAARPDRHVPAVRPQPRRASARRRAGTGSTTGSWTRRRGAPTRRCPTCGSTPPEALDIAEYLSTLKAPPGFEEMPLPGTDAATLDRIALYFQMSDKTLFDAKAALAKMDLHAKQVYAGEKLIAHYGCFACHAIPGFENAKPIGTELTEEGSKAVHRLDFGFIHIPHTRQDWFETKLHDPRIFDRDRARGWEEKLRMPDFRLSQAERDQRRDGRPGLPGVERGGDRDASSSRRTRPRSSAGGGSSRTTTAWAATSSRVSAARSARLVADPSLAPPDHPGAGSEGPERLALLLPEGAEDGPDPALARGPHADFRVHDRGAERPDAVLRVPRPGRVSLPRGRRRDGARAGWAAGRKVFELLRCAAVPPAQRGRDERARAWTARRSLRTSRWRRRRLRHDWIADWIRRPDEWMPGTRMPTNFPKGEDGKRISPDRGACSTRPTFAADRAEFARFLGGEEAREEVPRRPRRRDEGPARLRLVGRDQRGYGARAGRGSAGNRGPAAGSGRSGRPDRAWSGRSRVTLCRGSRRPLGAAWAATTRTSFSTGPVSAWRPRRSCCSSG